MTAPAATVSRWIGLRQRVLEYPTPSVRDSAPFAPGGPCDRRDAHHPGRDVMTDLRARVRDGDPAAFSELFDRYARAVYNHGFRLTAELSCADDIVSATFLEAWRSRDKLDEEGGSLRPWLLGIATNIARNLKRGDRRYRAAALKFSPADFIVGDHANAVISRVDDARRLQHALSVLATLNHQEREVVTLCLWEGLDYVTAAQAVGVPVGTIRSRLSRARAKLKKRTEAQMGLDRDTREHSGNRATEPSGPRLRRGEAR
jgi:RNA polymerase sigma factor (sigma-70 family)